MNYIFSVNVLVVMTRGALILNNISLSYQVCTTMKVDLLLWIVYSWIIPFTQRNYFYRGYFGYTIYSITFINWLYTEHWSVGITCLKETNIVGPDQTPRIMRGVWPGPMIFVAREHLRKTFLSLPVQWL